MPAKKELSDFIRKALEVHGDRYDYSKVNYVNNHTKVKIICPVHGIFEQTPAGHLLQRQDCPRCKKVFSTEDFITKCNVIHNNKYDYSSVEFINSKFKVKIICPIHGEFYQTPNTHIMGAGCPLCNKSNKLTATEFIKRSKHIHNNKFDYSLVEYVNCSTKVKIICPEHGSFEQTPIDHMGGSGCRKCSKVENTYDFIIKSNKIHNNYYDYSQSIFVSSIKKLLIICPKHGIFEQTPRKHLIGHGCPTCKRSRGENKIESILISKNIKYFNQYSFSDCKFNSLLFFDFYLPDLNMCIEFDGEQHFKSIKRWGGNEKLNEIVQRDSIKNEYCKQNNIKLLRIKFNENVEEKINLFIN